MENELDEINTDSHKKNPTITKPTNPEEVCRVIEICYINIVIVSHYCSFRDIYFIYRR